MTDRQTDRQTSAPFHDMATRSGPHNKRIWMDGWRYDCTKDSRRIFGTPVSLAIEIRALCTFTLHYIFIQNSMLFCLSFSDISVNVKAL